MKTMRVLLSFGPVAMLAGGMAIMTGPAIGQPAGISVQTGVYTAAQADRGMATFKAKGCVGCHGDDMMGTPGGPSLVGAQFPYLWYGKTAGELLAFLQANMPPGAAGSLNPGEYTDAMAAIFRANSFPAGENEMEAMALDRILIARE